jgi:hypothetical protein
MDEPGTESFAPCYLFKEIQMNRLAWIGIIVWGILVTGFGLASAGPAPGADPELQPHDVIFLVAGGLVTCLLGVTGLMGFMGWVPGLRKEQKKYA